MNFPGYGGETVFIQRATRTCIDDSQEVVQAWSCTTTNAHFCRKPLMQYFSCFKILKQSNHSYVCSLWICVCVLLTRTTKMIVFTPDLRLCCWCSIRCSSMIVCKNKMHIFVEKNVDAKKSGFKIMMQSNHSFFAVYEHVFVFCWHGWRKWWVSHRICVLKFVEIYKIHTLFFFMKKIRVSIASKFQCTMGDNWDLFFCSIFFKMIPRTPIQCWLIVRERGQISTWKWDFWVQHCMGVRGIIEKVISSQKTSCRPWKNGAEKIFFCPVFCPVFFVHRFDLMIPDPGTWRMLVCISFR